MLPDKIHDAITGLVRAENLLVILHERISRTGGDEPSQELTLTIRDGLAELREMLVEEERKVHSP